MSADTLPRKRRIAATAFFALLALSVFWPSPVVTLNRLFLHQQIDVDNLSFLGREAPQWDVIFWFFAGVLLLSILFTAEPNANPREPLIQLRALRFHRTLLRDFAIGLAIGALCTAIAWFFLDAPVLAWAERIQSDTSEDVIRILNRLGGGMNPVMVVFFFLIAGIAYVERRWVSYALSMSIAGLGAGILANIIKPLVGRARPELWLGNMHYAPGSSTSFPSGHTVGAFALAGVLIFASRNWPLRVLAFVLAAGVAMSRVLAFRHWMSDVTASAVVGLVMAWIITRVSLRHGETSAAAGDV